MRKKNKKKQKEKVTEFFEAGREKKFYMEEQQEPNSLDFGTPQENLEHYTPPVHYTPPRENPVHYTPPRENPVHYTPPVQYTTPPRENLVHQTPPEENLVPSLPDSSSAYAFNIETVPTVPTVPTFLPTVPRSRPKFTPENSFTIVCFNIRCDVDDPPHNWDSRKYEVFKNINRYKPSIVCLQESTEKVKQFLCNSLSYDAVGSYRDRSSRAEAGHVLFDSTKWKLLSHSSFVYTEAGIKPCGLVACNGVTKFKNVKDKHTRIFTHVRLKGTSEINVINTHFPLNKMLQMECAKQLREYINGISTTTNTPIIVTGDFNSHYEPTSKGTPLEELLTNANLFDANNLENIPTFGNFKKVKPKINKLDYILFRGLKVLNAGVSDYRYGKEQFRPSDHQALFANFVLNSVF
jgi:endonuclease/exonuclease/phosphatase family metal-dependent hydrolase